MTHTIPAAAGRARLLLLACALVVSQLGEAWPVRPHGQNALARSSSPRGHPPLQRPTRLLRATVWSRERHLGAEAKQWRRSSAGPKLPSSLLVPFGNGRFRSEHRPDRARPDERRSEQQRQRHMAALLVRGSVAHQSSASKAFQQGLYSPAGGSPLSPLRSRGFPRGPRGSRSPRSRSPFRRVSFDEADEPTTRVYPDARSQMDVAVAVALGSHLVDESSPAAESPRARSERMAPALTPRSGRMLFESNDRASNANGFASFGDWVALHTNG